MYLAAATISRLFTDRISFPQTCETVTFLRCSEPQLLTLGVSLPQHYRLILTIGGQKGGTRRPERFQSVSLLSGFKKFSDDQTSARVGAAVHTPIFYAPPVG